jgi:uncharacterized protein YbjQ (UPF0145 family)
MPNATIAEDVAGHLGSPIWTERATERATERLRSCEPDRRLETEPMLTSTTDAVPGRNVTEILGVVTGNTVRSKNVGKDIGAGLKSLAGGELKSYTDMLTEARTQAMARMCDAAREQGADAVIMMRFTTSAITQGAAELLAYGTAVKLSQ